MTAQQKDIIYIDVEDDITAIIGKVKDAKLKIVALVPPKRTGVLQSAVNLRLLARAADGADKRLVLITHNAALAGLAASADIPVAKTLQSRPEVAKVASNDDDDDEVIDGNDLPVGDHARGSGGESDKKEDIIPASSISGLDIDGESQPADMTPRSKSGEKKPTAKRGISVPDFGSFRKRLAIGAAAGVLLIGFFVWAIWFAPRATVVVSAKTTGQAITTPVTLGADLTTSAKDATIKSIKYEEKMTQTVDFEATGSKNVGNKATGTVEFSRQSQSPSTVPAGTKLTANNGRVFVTNSAVTIPASTPCFPVWCAGEADVDVTASEGGTGYNGISGGVNGVSGVTATFSGSTSGGTDKTAKVVSQEDIDKAKEALTEAKQGDALKKLKDKFEKSDIIIEESLTPTGGDPKSSPALDQEATDGKATLTSEVTYTLIGISREEMNDYLDSAVESTLTDKERQRVYKNGIDGIVFEDFHAADADNKSDAVTVVATAQIGPKINEDEIKEHAKGKRSGEIIGDIKAIDGVSDVEVKLSPFWVTGVPDDIKKINVEFKLLEKD